jgi:hypothetical protein
LPFKCRLYLVESAREIGGSGDVDLALGRNIPALATAGGGEKHQHKSASHSPILTDFS